MLVGIDCRTMNDPAGIGVYTRELVKNLLALDRENEFVLFVPAGQTVPFLLPENMRVKYLVGYTFKKYLPLIYSQLIVAYLIGREKPDTCLFPANVMPLCYRGKSVVTVHDLAVYKFPELFPDKLVNFDRRVSVPWSLKKASRIIAVSQSTKQDIIEIFNIKPEKIAVVYEAAEVLDGIETPADGGEYFLFLGSIEPRKNLVRIIKSYKKFVQAEKWYGELRLAGGRGWKNAEVFDLIEKTNQELGREAIKYLGYVSAPQKFSLLKGARALVFPSIYEGFGLPLVEAMAIGTPIITSDNGAMVEVAGDAAILVDPFNETQLAEAYTKIVRSESLREELISKGKIKAQEYSWARAARETLAELESVGKSV